MQCRNKASQSQVRQRRVWGTFPWAPGAERATRFSGGSRKRVSGRCGKGTKIPSVGQEAASV